MSQTRRKKYTRRAILRLIAGFSLIAPIASSAQDPELSRLAWLAGCGAAERGDAGSGEQWTPLAGGTMLGVGRMVRDGKTVDHEFLQIRRNEEGKVVYIALPAGQAEASFTLTSATEDAATFENLAHDFPQRILYRLFRDGRLLARIEGNRGGAPSGVDFPMRRVPCDNVAAGALAPKD